MMKYRKSLYVDRGLGARRVKREDLLIIMLTPTKLTQLLLGFSIKTKNCINVSIEEISMTFSTLEVLIHSLFGKFNFY